MDESEAKAIHTADDIGGYTYLQLHEADLFLKDYALNRLEECLKDIDPTTRDFVLLMVKGCYGSIEVDQYLIKMQCYPDWVK